MRYFKSIIPFFILQASVICMSSDAMGQKESKAIDRSFHFYPLQFCDQQSDTKVYRHEKSFPEEVHYTIEKRRGVYLIIKEAYHKDYTRPDGGGHLHKFKPVVLDSFPPLEYPSTLIELIANENIKPFSRYEVDSIGNKKEKEVPLSHDCIMEYYFEVNGMKIRKQIPQFSLMREYGVRSTDGQFLNKMDNINYSYNNSLNAVKVFWYVNTLIENLELEKKFVLIKEYK